MLATRLLLLVVHIQWVSADYRCLCNNNIDLTVFSTTSELGSTVGYMHESDCAELIPMKDLADGWFAVSFGNKIGYVRNESHVIVQICNGDPPAGDIDIVSTTVTTADGTTTLITSDHTPMTSTTASVSSAPSTGATMVTSSSSEETGHLELCPSQVVHAAYIGHGLVAQYGISCYEVVPSLISWTHAENNCKNSGGHLVTINSDMEQNFLYNFLDTNYNHTMWIGLHDRQHEENFTWVSGESVSYTNWVPNRKSDSHDSEDCVYMVPSQDLQGKWDDIKCGGDNGFTEAFGERHRYICEYHIDPTMTTFAPVSPGSHTNDGNTMLCPASIRQHGERFGGFLAQYKENCYELLPRHPYSWTHGEQVCEAHGGNLAHISDADEQDFIQQFMKRHYPDHAVWIGLTDRGHEGNYTWTSGVPAQFTNWTPDHVGNFVDPSREDCVAFLPYQNGEWDDVTCGSSSFFGGDRGETHPILCQYQTDVAGSIIG